MWFPIPGWLNPVDRFVLASFLPLAVAILLSSLDDLMVDLAWGGAWLKTRLRPEPSLFPPGERQLEAAPRRRIAILVALWKEHEVIGQMLEHTLHTIRYQDYHIFAGTYPNDHLTQEAVRAVAKRFPDVHLVLCPHGGPTSKADCLNWIYEHLTLYEQRDGRRFDVVVTHDAEDLIHPDELLWINYYSARYDFIQTPVLPLATSVKEVTHGLYCDEFAEYHTRDMVVRPLLGGFLPGAGVGTGYSRDALDKLAGATSRHLFDPQALTEDYENGLKLFRLGCSQAFVPPVKTQGNHEFFATREFFPKTRGAALRQRSRWVTGIALQSWQNHGWRGSPGEVYWLWRDRKGLITSPLSLCGNLILVYGFITALWTRMTPVAMHVAAITLGFQCLRLAVRSACVTRVYGLQFALGVPFRCIYGNLLNATANCSAVTTFLLARVRHRGLRWAKTDHSYPSRAVLQALGAPPESPPGQVRPDEVPRRVAHALPEHAVRQFQVLPFRVVDGSLFLAAPETPSKEAKAALRRFTSLELRFHLVTSTEFEKLTGALL